MAKHWATVQEYPKMSRRNQISTCLLASDFDHESTGLTNNVARISTKILDIRISAPYHLEQRPTCPAAPFLCLSVVTIRNAASERQETQAILCAELSTALLGIACAAIANMSSPLHERVITDSGHFHVMCSLTVARKADRVSLLKKVSVCRHRPHSLARVVTLPH